MIEKFLDKWIVQIIIHCLIVVFVFLNGFYLVETYKISKKNIILTDYKTTINQSINNLKNQNSYELLDLYKDKIIKRSSYKKTDEQVYDISNLENNFDQNSTQDQSKPFSNFNNWYKCLVKSNKFSTTNPESFCK